MISGNEDQGVHLNNPGAVGNRVESNTIGLESNGDDPIGNGENGIKIEQGASSNVVRSPAAPNTISANTDDGVLILDPGSTGNIVSSNLVGTNPAGVSPRGNGDDGIEIDSAAFNTIEGNLVSANFETGINRRRGMPRTTSSAPMWSGWAWRRRSRFPTTSGSSPKATTTSTRATRSQATSSRG